MVSKRKKDEENKTKIRGGIECAHEARSITAVGMVHRTHGFDPFIPTRNIKKKKLRSHQPPINRGSDLQNEYS